MAFKILFKEIKKSAATELKIHEKVAKFDHYFMQEPEINWYSYKHGDHHYTEVSVYDGNHHYHAKADHENLYKTFDLVTGKLTKQLQRRATKLKNKLHKKHPHIDFDGRPLHKKYAA